MNELTVLLTPVLVFFIIALFGFVGCGKFLAAPDTEEPPPQKPPEVEPPPQQPPVIPPVVPPTYKDIVQGTQGFLALWLLNETSGNVAKVEGPLNPDANGVYTTAVGAPAGTGYTLGKEGVLFPKDSKDFAPEFTGDASYIEVPFLGPLNPDPKGLGFSIELWVKPDPTGGSDRHVLVSSHNFESPQKQQGYEIGLLKVQGQAHQLVYARVYSATGQTQTEVTVQPLQGDASEWRHVVLTYKWDGMAGSIQLRVQLKTTELFGSNPKPADYEQVTAVKIATLRFAANHQSTPGVALAAGRLDNIAIYNAPLTQADLVAHFDFVAK